MAHTTYGSTPSRFRRLGGPLGGVSSGLGRSFNISTNLVRLAFVLLTAIFGLVILAAYLALWFLMPIDPSVPEEYRPEPNPPLSLVVIVAVLWGLGAVFDLTLGLVSMVFSLVPLLVVVGAIGLLLFLWSQVSGRGRPSR